MFNPFTLFRETRMKITEITDHLLALDAKVDTIKADFLAFKASVETAELPPEAVAALIKLEGSVGEVDALVPAPAPVPAPEPTPGPAVVLSEN